MFSCTSNIDTCCVGVEKGVCLALCSLHCCDSERLMETTYCDRARVLSVLVSLYVCCFECFVFPYTRWELHVMIQSRSLGTVQVYNL